MIFSEETTNYGRKIRNVPIKNLFFAGTASVGLVAGVVGYRPHAEGNASIPHIGFAQLMSDPSKYTGKEIDSRGYEQMHPLPYAIESSTQHYTPQAAETAVTGNAKKAGTYYIISYLWESLPTKQDLVNGAYKGESLQKPVLDIHEVKDEERILDCDDDY